MPILFKGDMVRAILEGQKTQTRRILKPQPLNIVSFTGVDNMPTGEFGACMSHHGVISQHIRCPYGQPGDRLMPAVEIEGFDRKYAAGVDGRIYSRARGRWRPLKAWRQPKGYLSVTLMDSDGRKRTKTLHRMVCEAFYGAAPTGAHQVRHLDGNPENGSPDNLAWGTQEDNWRDRKAHGNGIEGEKHHDSKFSDSERANIRWAIESGLCSKRHAARALGVSQSTIQQICGFHLARTEQDIPADRIRPITLEVTDVRVERLQDISEEDAQTEGVEQIRGGYWKHYDPGWTQHQLSARGSFVTLWNSINGTGSWDANPWVWVVKFRRVEQ